MALYEYRCAVHGPFDVARPLGTAPAAAPCPACAADAPRVFSSPMLRSQTPRALVNAVDRAEKSRSEPEVVTSLPSAGARRRTPVAPLTPKLARLPRP